MLTIEPPGAVLGATARDIDLAQPLSERDMGIILLSLGKYGVLRFPEQHLELGDLKRFSEQFGEIEGLATRGKDSNQQYPEIDILSNLKENRNYIGSPDAAQDWHTDMTYREVPGFVNVLYGIRIPHRDGKSLGGTEIGNMHSAYEALPDEIKTRRSSECRAADKTELCCASCTTIFAPSTRAFVSRCNGGGCHRSALGSRRRCRFAGRS
jgi:taurine dioxygenase